MVIFDDEWHKRSMRLTDSGDAADDFRDELVQVAVVAGKYLDADVRFTGGAGHITDHLIFGNPPGDFLYLCRFDLNEDVRKNMQPKATRIDVAVDGNDAIADEAFDAVAHGAFGNTSDALGDLSATHAAIFDQQVRNLLVHPV